MDTVIQVEKLRHLYGSHMAIEDLSFSVGRGEVFGLLGPNGAGKTTTIRLLNGMFEPSKGKISVMNLDPEVDGAQIRRLSGVLTETPALYERLTARQNLRFFGTLVGLSDSQIKQRSEELLELFDLKDRANDRTGTYSKGMKQRLAIARAWISRPRLLFLDEPTSGLDPQAALQVRELIAQVREQEGTTVLLCTHNLDEAQKLCDRLLIMRKGASLAQGSMAELRRIVSPGLWLEIELQQPYTGVEMLSRQAGVLHLLEDGPSGIRLELSDPAYIPEVVHYLATNGALIVRVQPQEISLEEVYLKLQESNGGNHG